MKDTPERQSVHLIKCLLQNTMKTKDWATRTPLKAEVELRCSGMVSSSSSTSDNIYK
jgi:hypothetical protein